MTKKELVSIIGERSDVSNKIISEILDSALDVIMSYVADGEKVKLNGRNKTLC